MKTIKIMATNIRSKSVSIIMILILFAIVMFSAGITTGCCGPGWLCGPYYYGPPPGHGDNGWHNGNNGWHGHEGDGH